MFKFFKEILNQCINQDYKYIVMPLLKVGHFKKYHCQFIRRKMGYFNLILLRDHHKNPLKYVSLHCVFFIWSLS